MEHPAIEVRLLGSFEVRVRGAVAYVPRGRPRALLASLALAAGRVLSVERLTERMWGDEPPLRSRNAVQNNIRRLRQVLGADAILTTADGYLLPADPDHVDALRFSRLVERAAESDPDTARPLLVEALRLWRGEPLVGVEHGSLERDQAPRLIERYLSAVEHRVDIDLNAGRHGELIAELQELTARFPLRESLWTRLLTALERSGRRAEALESYDRVRRLLVAQLGTDPSAELQQSYRRLLAADQPPAEQPAAEPAQRPPTAEPASPPDEPAAARLATPPRQLPPDVPGLIGRAAEMAGLDQMLDTPDQPVRVAVLHGIGGIGKTALATRWAHRVSSRFPDGQLYLNLRGYGPEPPLAPAAALSALLRSVGIPAKSVPSEAAEAAGLWRTTMAERRMLVLLDNARDAEQVRPLLPGWDNVVLVTSRNQLSGLSVRDGARRFWLQELPETDAIALLAAVVGEQRVGAEPEAAGELVALCGRMPLALRISAELASRFPEAPLADFVAELRDRRGRLDALADGEDASADVRAVFSWSYLTLKPELARAFRLLGRYPGDDISLPAAAALLGQPTAEARALLAKLYAVHLVEQRRPGRFQMHDLLREYAAERAEAESSGERDQAIERLLTWYLATACNGRIAFGYDIGFELAGDANALPAPALDFEDSAAAVDWFQAERLALLGAVRQAGNGFPRHAWQFARALRHFFDIRGYQDDWLEVAEIGFASAQAAGDSLGVYEAALILGSGLSQAGRGDEARRVLHAALDAATMLRDPAKESSVLSALGIEAYRAGDYPAATGYHQQAVTAARRGSRERQLANALLNFGYTQIEAGDATSGIRHTEESLQLYRRMDTASGEAWALGNLAEAYQKLGRNDTALEYGELAVGIIRTLGDKIGVAEVLLTVGRARRALGQRDAARAAWDEARELLPDTHPLVGDVTALLVEQETPPVS